MTVLISALLHPNSCPETASMPKISAAHVPTSVTNVQMNAECLKTSIARHVLMNAAGVLRNAAVWLECSLKRARLPVKKEVII